MNLGNIWSNYNNNNVNNTKKINTKINTKINKYNTIFQSKTGINKAHKALNNPEKIVTGFSNNSVLSSDSRKFWGTPTWFLFHSIAARIDPIFHKENPHIIWDFIKQTCSVLPCPYCRYHAVNYVNKIQI